MFGLRGVVVVLHQDLEVAARAVVHEVDELLRVLGAALGVVARGDDLSRRFLDEKQIVIVRRSTHRIVPRQEDQHFTAVRQRDQVVRLRSEPEDIGRVVALLKQMQVAGIANAAASDVASTPES